jgi:hypothetical protein
MFNITDFPESFDNFDGPNVDLVLGTLFRMEKQATITAFRFFKARNEADHHVGNLYNFDGDIVATTGQFSTKDCSEGWVQVPFLRPFRPQLGAEYTVAVDSVKYYVKTDNYPWFEKADQGVVPIAGYYSTEPGTLPVFGPGTTNYWVDGKLPRLVRMMKIS